jgi:hypothetical protein
MLLTQGKKIYPKMTILETNFYSNFIRQNLPRIFTNVFFKLVLTSLI